MSQLSQIGKIERISQISQICHIGQTEQIRHICKIGQIFKQATHIQIGESGQIDQTA